MVHRSRVLLCLTGALVLGCGGGSSSSSGGVVGFATGTETAGPVPVDGTSAAAPVVTALTAASTSISKGQPLRVNLNFSDPQGDVAVINFGIAGEDTHSVLSADMVGSNTSGTVTLDLYPANYVAGVHVLMVSLTDKAGHVSASATLAFTIVGGATGAGGAIDSGAILGAGGGGGSRLDAAFGVDGLTVTPVLDGGPGSQETILFKMESVQGVSFNPPVTTIFTLPTASYITRVMTYHYGATIGSKSPTVAFKDTTTGAIYGPWLQVGYKSFNGTAGATRSDPGNVAGPPDNYWLAYPAQIVPAGTYQVVDSDPTTWAYTADLGNRGCAWVYGWSLGGAIDGGAPGLDAKTSDASVTTGDVALITDAPSPADTPVAAAWSIPVLIENGAGTVTSPKLAMDSSGNIIAVWVQGDGTSNNYQNIYANRYTAGGGWGTPTLLETSDMPADSPLVATDSNGNAIAVWHQAWNLVNGTNYGLYANRYVPGVGWGAATTVFADTSTTSTTANAPDQLAFDANGNAMVAWTFYEWSWNHTSVHTTRYVAGTGWAAAELMDTGTASASSPSVAFDAAGNATVLWVQGDSGNDVVYANRYVPGTGWGTATLVDTAARGGASAPRMVFTSDGNAIATWFNYGLLGITADRYLAASGWGTPVTIIETGDTGYDQGLQFALDKSGNAVAVWNNYGGGLFASRTLAGGNWDTPSAIESGGSDYSGQVAFYANGNALAVWGRFAANSSNIWSSKYVVGTGWSTPIMVNATPDNTSDPHMVIDKNGLATAVWVQSGSLYASSAAF